MLDIEERNTSKVPGMTSFFFKPHYNQKILDVIKTLGCKNYSKKSKEWEIPVNELSKLIDGLCEIDSIRLKFKKNDIDINPNIKPIVKYKINPFQHQIEAIKYGLEHNKFLLLDKMGLGKSYSAICIAEELKAHYNIEHCLIVCGVNSLKSNWRKEIMKHSNLDCIILGEKRTKKGKLKTNLIQDRIEHLLKPINEFFIITNIETLRDTDVLECIMNGPNKIDLIIVDEIQFSKNPSSKQGQNLLNLKSKYQIGMTGTLLINNPLDLYVPLKWIDADNSTLTNFKSNYCVYDDKFHNIIIGYKNLDILKHQLNKSSLRRSKDILGLPLKTIVPEYLDMKEDQLVLYKELEQVIVADEELKLKVQNNIDLVDIKPDSLLSILTRLRQLTSLPSLLTSKNISNIKFERVKELVEEIIQNDEKIVIFSSFTNVVYELKELLKKYNPVIYTGELKKEVDLADIADKFQTDPNSKIFIGTWQSSGTGVTLTSASYMIFVDTPWTDAQFQQNCDRIYRIGTLNPVFIYVLICNDTIDEVVYDIINTKQAISDYIVDDIITPSGLEKLKKYVEDLN